MKKLRSLTTIQVILLLNISIFLTGTSGMASGDEAFSVDQKEMPTVSCYTQSSSILSGNMIEINQGTCMPGPYICIGCFEYACIGLSGYGTIIMDACLLLTFCFVVSDCQALCISLLPENPDFR
jgi:hypothetical protein